DISLELSFNARAVPDATLPAQPFMLSLQRHGASQRLAAQVWVPPNISMCQGLPNAVPGMTDLEIEFFFVVDPSVTMRGPRLAKVRQALRVLLRSLPNAAVVNVVGLSSQSSADALFPESRPLNSQTFDAVDEFLKRDAEEFLDSVTGLHSLLSTVFDTRRDSSQLRVALITDRYPPDQKASVQLLEESCDANCRVFVLGLGWGASPLFVEQASKVGHGSYAYVAERDVSYGIEKNLLAQMVDACVPAFDDVMVRWSTFGNGQLNASKLVGEELVEVEAFEEDVKNRGLAMAILGEVPGDLASAALGTLSIEVSLGTQTFHATATPPSGPIMVGSSLHAVVARQMVQEGRAPSAAWAASLGIPSGSFQWNSVDRAGRSTPLRCEEKVEKVERLQPELSTRAPWRSRDPSLDLTQMGSSAKVLLKGLTFDPVGQREADDCASGANHVFVDPLSLRADFTEAILPALQEPGEESVFTPIQKLDLGFAAAPVHVQAQRCGPGWGGASENGPDSNDFITFQDGIDLGTIHWSVA
ncbi:von Willebrand factor A domain-containing protein DDB_G0292028, partial [Durusdinium trenchii]